MKKLILLSIVIAPLLMMAQQPKMHIKFYLGFNGSSLVYRAENVESQVLGGVQIGGGFRIEKRKSFAEIDFGYLLQVIKYSPREGTKAFRMEDDVNEETKSKRLQEIIDLQQQISYDINQELIGTEDTVLVEGSSKKSDQFFAGRTDTNKVVIFPKDDIVQEGSYVKVKINRATQATLFGEIVSTVDVNLALIA